MMGHTDGLSLDFQYDCRASRTVLHVNEQRQPVKVVRAFDSDADTALVHVHNLSGGVLAGVRLSLDLTVGARAGAGANVWRDLERPLLQVAQKLSSPVIIWGLGRLPAHGFVVRALGLNGREIASGLIAFWRDAKHVLYGRDAVIPHKIY
jgi:urease accessory protein UreH